MLRKLINRFTCNEKHLPLIINKLHKNNLYPIFDYINENNKNHYNNFKVIKKTIEKYPNNYFAIKCSSLNIDNDYNLAKTYIEELSELSISNNSKLLIDAENYLIQNDINILSDYLIKKYNKTDTHIYKTYQAYRTDCYQSLTNDIDLRNISNDYFLGVKLVRGAYYNSDIEHNILFDMKKKTDLEYDKCALYFMKNCHDNDKLMIASHNENSIEKCDNIKNILCLNNIEYAQLMGMSDSLSINLAKYNKTFKYVPYGSYIESIPYLLRRLNENKSLITHLYKL